ncbi:MAG: hypothetical protein JNJ50_10740 [Acidobacteria bacterium]|nr:hypothetical protein [Acidobacteriota bacterium]
MTNTPCANHPEIAGENLCDGCDRFLCAQCLGLPVKRLGRTYFYCRQDSCKRAYLLKLKIEGLSLVFLLVAAALYLLTDFWVGAGFSLLVLSCLPSARERWKEYQQRQNA